MSALVNKFITSCNILFSEPIYSEDCFCPNGGLENWSKIAKCPSTYKQIDIDLKPFKDVNFDDVLDVATVRYNQTGSKSFCNYVILNNKVSFDFFI